jgi:DNA-binding NtrC family response regulator
MSVETTPLRAASRAAPNPSTSGDFEEFLRYATPEQSVEPQSLRAWLDRAEAWKITQTLRTCRGNRSAAARALGIGRRTLYAKMDKLQITTTWAVGQPPTSATEPR